MNNREEITIAPETRATIVYAKATKPLFQDWLLLIDRVAEEHLHIQDTNDLMIYTHVSWNVTQGMDTSNVGENCNWGYVYQYGYKFYKPTEGDVKKIKKILKMFKKRYVKGVNKLFDR